MRSLPGGFREGVGGSDTDTQDAKNRHGIWRHTVRGLLFRAMAQMGPGIRALQRLYLHRDHSTIMKNSPSIFPPSSDRAGSERSPPPRSACVKSWTRPTGIGRCSASLRGSPGSPEARTTATCWSGGPTTNTSRWPLAVRRSKRMRPID